MQDSIRKWNFWWNNPERLKQFNWTERTILPKILKLINQRHIKDIIGIRRAGKTFLMYQVINSLIDNSVRPKEILYLNFDDPEFTDIKATISSALELNSDINYVFLDEVQNIKGWEAVIRTYYDRKEFKQIFLSGSSASIISRDIGRMLTGRHLTIFMSPFSFKEYLLFHNVNYQDPFQKEKVIHYLERFLKEGGFPEAVRGDAAISKDVLVNIYNDLLMRDIISRFGVDAESVKKLAYYLMTNIASPFSENSLAKALGIHHETVKKYLWMFEEVFLFHYVKFFSWKIKVQVKKDMKCYSADTGLRNAVSFKFSEGIGRLAENAVLIELKRRGRDVYFYKGSKEVDFIIRTGNELTAINVSYTDAPKKREIEGLLEFQKRYKYAKLILITRNIERKGIVKYVPLWKWLLSST